MKNKTPP